VVTCIDLRIPTNFANVQKVCLYLNICAVRLLNELNPAAGACVLRAESFYVLIDLRNYYVNLFPVVK
jgi:hypothetical protein